jgi:hypothetical protein
MSDRTHHRERVATYLDRVAREATDRPRALAASILAEALRRPLDADLTALRYVEERVRAYTPGGAMSGPNDGDDTAAEIVYEIGSILVELQERFPDARLALGGASDEY